MKTVKLLNSTLNYINPTDSKSEKVKLLKDVMPDETEFYTVKTNDEIENEHPVVRKLGKRNLRDVYEIDIEKPEVLLNFIPSKNFIFDSKLNYFVDNSIEFFELYSPADELGTPFELEEGTIFRVLGEGVKDLREYNYKKIENGEVKEYPNFKSVQVDLIEKGQLIDAIRVIEPLQFKDVLRKSNENKCIKAGCTPSDATKICAAIAIIQDAVESTAPPDSVAAKIEAAVSEASTSSTDSGAGIDSSGAVVDSAGEPISLDTESTNDRQSEWTPDFDTLTFSEAFLEIASTKENADQKVFAIRREIASNISAFTAKLNELQSRATSAIAAFEQARAEAAAIKARADAFVAQAEEQGQAFTLAAQAAIERARAMQADAERLRAIAEERRFEYELQLRILAEEND